MVHYSRLSRLVNGICHLLPPSYSVNPLCTYLQFSIQSIFLLPLSLWLTFLDSPACSGLRTSSFLRTSSLFFYSLAPFFLRDFPAFLLSWLHRGRGRETERQKVFFLKYNHISLICSCTENIIMQTSIWVKETLYLVLRVWLKIISVLCLSLCGLQFIYLFIVGTNHTVMEMKSLSLYLKWNCCISLCGTRLVFSYALVCCCKLK